MSASSSVSRLVQRCKAGRCVKKGMVISRGLDVAALDARAQPLQLRSLVISASEVGASVCQDSVVVFLSFGMQSGSMRALLCTCDVGLIGRVCTAMKS